MKVKKGQLTLFVILGVVVIVGLIGYVGLSNSDIKLFTSASNDKVGSFRDNVKSCYVELTHDSLDYVGYQGGYYNDFEGLYLYDDEGYILPYYYSKGEVIMPSLSDIESELGNFIDSNIYSCLEGTSEFNLSYGSSDTEVKVREGIVMFNTKLAIEVNYENETFKFDLSDDSVVVDSKLKEMYEISKFYVDFIKSDENEWVPITELGNRVDNNDLFIRIYDYVGEENDQKVVIYTNDTSTYPLMIRFVNKYNYKDLNLPNGLGLENE